MKKVTCVTILPLFFLTLLLPFSFLFAHEVYVLPEEVVEAAMTQPPLQVFDVIYDNAGSFFFWSFITLWAIFTIASISVSKPLERLLSPLLARLKPLAPLAARVTLGSAVFASGLFGAMFGPELGFEKFLSPAFIPLFKILLITLGTFIMLGLFTRIASLALVGIYAFMWTQFGTYMFTYTNYFGEMLIVLIVGNAMLALDSTLHHLYPAHFHRVLEWFEEHAFLILRVAFGFSLIFASMYAKFLYAELALQTVIEYNLTNYFPFEPHFLVLGAFAIELLIGLFIMFGIEVRFATLFLGFFLVLSLIYFKEAVWPHIILFGGAAAIFMHGYDRFTLELRYLRRRNKGAREPIF